MQKKIDMIDRRILNELQKNGRMSIVELASQVHLTKTPCVERVRRLERSGVIKGYRAVLDPEALGANFVVIVHVTLDQTSDNALEKFNAAIGRIPEVRSCYMLASNFDYMLKVCTSDIAHFRKVLGDQIGKLPNVRQTSSFVAMEIVKDDDTILVGS